MPDMRGKVFPIPQTTTVTGVVLIDPETEKPYSASSPDGGSAESGDVNVISSALPTGAATQATLEALRTLVAAGINVSISNASIPVTDNGGSLTVDGTVGISGTVPISSANAIAVTDNNGSLTVDGSVGITGTPNVAVTNTPTVTVSNASLPVSGTVAVSAVSGTVTVGTHAVTQSGSWTQTPTGAATLTTSPTAVSVGTTSVSLAASVSGRRSVIIQNMGATALYLSFAATALATAPTFVIAANGWMVIDRETWTGAITAIRASGSATADAIVTVTS